ncbi:MAG: hypothetical protein OXG15_16470 [Gammaproteobacteria bacterium]|nr:hypothetical protein [Gammaproteobacteria bacterium]
MTAFATIRPVGPDDASDIVKLAENLECVQWGGLPPLTTQLLLGRWRQPNITPTFVQVVETDRGLQGYSDVYQVTPQLARFHGVATNVEMAAKLIDWTRDKTASQGMTLQTSLSSKVEGRTLFPKIVDHPLYSLVAKTGFTPVSTTRVMRLRRNSESIYRTFPKSYRLTDYDESLLPALIATYYAAWPKDYYEGDETSDIAEIFRQANPRDLRLVISDVGEVVAYVLVSRTT